MNGRERILKTFKGEKVDRVPICPWIYNNLIYRYFNRPVERNTLRENDLELVEMTIEATDYFGFDHFHRQATPVHAIFYNENEITTDKWNVEIEFKDFKGKETEITTISTPERKLRQVKEFNKTAEFTYIEAIVEYFIKDKQDFEQFVKFQPSFKDDAYPQFVDQYKNITRARKLLEEKGVVCAYMFGGAFNILNLYRNLESIMMDPFTDIGFFKRMIEYFGNRTFEIYEKMAEHGSDVIEIGANLAGGGVGEKFFRDFVMEYEIEHINKIHSLGAKVLYHNCGDADRIMHIYNEMGMDAWGYLTPPPYGDVDLDKALKTMNKEMVLVGNIDQVDFLVKASVDEVKHRVKEILDKAKKRGNFILSTSDWPFDNVPIKNLKALADAGHEFGVY